MISIVHIDTSFVWVTIVWLALGIFVWSAQRIRPALDLRTHGIVISAAATAPWIKAAAPAAWLYSEAPMLLYRGLLLALGVAAVQFVLSLLTRRSAQCSLLSRSASLVTICISVVVLFTATSLEVARVARMLTETSAGQRAAVSIWWGIFAIGLLVIGMVRRGSELRRIGLVLLGVATLKAVVFDLTDVSAGWRVASFLILGLIMLTVALAYAKVNALLLDDATVEPPGIAPADEQARATE